jgi:hypothetical protein
MQGILKLWDNIEGKSKGMRLLERNIMEGNPEGMKPHARNPEVMGQRRRKI